jgi:succinate dehydrogenase/fumarate reductase-like Fe-S protein
MGGGSWKRDGKREFYEGPILQTALLKWVMRHGKRFLAGKKVQVALGSVCRQCGDCQGCAALCAHRVPVARRVDELRAMLG